MNPANRWVRAGLAAALALLMSSAAAELLKPLQVNAIPASPPDGTFAYGSDANQFAELFLPQGRGPFPVAVVIHGGCWKKFADLNNTVPMSDALRKAGIAPILMTEPRWGDKAEPNGIGEHPNVRLEPFVVACRRVAKETKVPLIDHFAQWSKKQAEGFDVGNWTTDQCHPNPEGHKVMAEAIWPTVVVVLHQISKKR